MQCKPSYGGETEVVSQAAFALVSNDQSAGAAGQADPSGGGEAIEHCTSEGSGDVVALLSPVDATTHSVRVRRDHP